MQKTPWKSQAWGLGKCVKMFCGGRAVARAHLCWAHERQCLGRLLPREASINCAGTCCIEDAWTYVFLPNPTIFSKCQTSYIGKNHPVGFFGTKPLGFCDRFLATGLRQSLLGRETQLHLGRFETSHFSEHRCGDGLVFQTFVVLIGFCF